MSGEIPSFTGRLVDDAFDLEALFGLALRDLPFNAFFVAEVVEAPAEEPPRGVWVFRRLTGHAELVAEHAKLAARGTLRVVGAGRLVAAPAELHGVGALRDRHADAHDANTIMAQTTRRNADDLLALEERCIDGAAQAFLSQAMRTLETRSPGTDLHAVLAALIEDLTRDLGPLLAWLARARQQHQHSTRIAEALAGLACCPGLNPEDPFDRALWTDLVDAIPQEVVKHRALGALSFQIRPVWGLPTHPPAETVRWSDGTISVMFNMTRLSLAALPEVLAHEVAQVQQLASRASDHEYSAEELAQLEQDAVAYVVSVADDSTGGPR